MTVLDIRFSDWIQKGFRLFLDNALVLMVSGLVALLISGITLGLLSGPMLAGLAIIVVNLMDEKLARPTVNDLFKGFDFFMPTIPVTLALYVLCAASFLLNFIPGPGFVLNAVVISVGSALAVLVVFHLVVRRIDPRESIMTWLEIFKMNWGPLLGFFILLSVIGGVGMLAFYIGLVVTVPVYLCIMGVAYVSILKQSAAL